MKNTSEVFGWMFIVMLCVKTLVTFFGLSEGEQSWEYGLTSAMVFYSAHLFVGLVKMLWNRRKGNV
jgi:hypothetical protein